MAMPSLSLRWADGGYAGKLVDADRVADITVGDLARKPLGIRCSRPSMPVGGRAHIRLDRERRRLDHYYERLPETSVAMIKWAMIGIAWSTTRAATSARKPWQRASTAA